ncbi:hypothetical protein HY991_04110 [Candidatus Micrarchaeota archaeon]|nr:hypothetical protein [Candidatus Micrarchaeota archaeon]
MDVKNVLKSALVGSLVAIAAGAIIGTGFYYINYMSGLGALFAGLAGGVGARSVLKEKAEGVEKLLLIVVIGTVAFLSIYFFMLAQAVSELAVTDSEVSVMYGSNFFQVLFSLFQRPGMFVSFFQLFGSYMDVIFYGITLYGTFRIITPAPDVEEKKEPMSKNARGAKTS